MNTQGYRSAIFRFLSAQTISLFGSSLVQYAIIWHITLSTSSGKMLTISTLCGFLPQIAISLFAGVLLDRFDRQKMIMLSDGIIALSTLIVAIAFMSGYTSIWLLFAVLAARSAASGIQAPAVNAVIPQIVPASELMRINGINSTLSSLMMLLSPALSGAIISVLPFEYTLLIDVLTAVVGISITAGIFIKPYEKSGGECRSALSEIKAGFTYLRGNSTVLRLIGFQLVILFLISPSAFLTPLMVSRTFGAEVWRLTASEMTYSLGMVFGGLLISAWGGFKKNRLSTTLLAGSLYGAMMIGLGLAPFFLLYLIFNTIIGISSPCYNAPITVTIQESVPSHMQGRVFSFMQIASSCALPLGMLVFGPLSDKLAVSSILVFCGCAVLLTIFISFAGKLFKRSV